MRVGIFINRTWNIYNFRKGIINGLQEAGHEVYAVAPRDEYAERLEEMGCKHLHLPMSDTGSNPVKELLIVFRLYQLLKTHQVDFLLTYTIKSNLYGVMAAKLLGIPVICNVSGLGAAFLSKGLSAMIARKLSSWVLGKADHLFFQNKDDRNDFIDATGIKNQSISLLPGSGIDLQKFQFESLTGKEEIDFLMLSRVIVEKGVRELAEAAREVKQSFPNANFTLIGSHDSDHARSIPASEFSSWQEEGLIHYIPHIDDVALYIKNSQAMILPSYREGTPRTLLEGAALGRPLISVDVPGCREVVSSGENGFLGEPRNAESLAKCCLDFLSLSGDEKQKMGVASRRIAELKFDEQIVVSRYLDKVSQLK